MKNSKGLSQVVTTVLLILLAVVLVSAVWGIVNSFVNNRLGGASSCLEVLDKVKLNNDWTCYNESSNSTLVSIEIGDIEIDSVLVSVSFGDHSTVFRILNESTLVENVTEYTTGEITKATISLPTLEGGKTYVLGGVYESPLEIVISAELEGEQCGISDFTESVYSCRSL